MDRHLVVKSRLLIRRRNEGVTTGTYLRDQWRRHAISATCFTVFFAVACLIGNYYVAVFVGTLGATGFLRDLRWYRALSREWNSTKEILDWEKIERIANSGEP